MMFERDRRVGEIRAELRALDAAQAAGSMSAEQYADQRRELGETLLKYIAIEPKHSTSLRYSAIVVAVVVPLAALGLYRWRSTRPATQTHASMLDTAARPVDHGVDMQAAISKLAAKLREHPDDAEGWALLGRTYKATEHYSEARDAFKHAVAAAPGDAGFEREYAAAETPNDASREGPENCPTASMDSACTANRQASN